MTKTNWLLTICVVTLIAIGCKSTLYSEGERVYTAYCSNCHMDDGSGLAALIPPLTDMEYLQANITMLPCIITNGMAGSQCHSLRPSNARSGAVGCTVTQSYQLHRQ